jgi:RNA 2',3'-cyclic 3'-phosphodiesterase
MRLFIAIDVNDAVRNEMRRVRAEIESSLASQSRRPRVRWVSPDNAHVTVRFLGEVDESAAARLSEAMLPPLGLTPFEIVWADLGGFPSAKAPRAIWIGAVEGGDQLQALVNGVAARVDPLLGPDESRRFQAHLTVGRVRDHHVRINWRAALESARSKPVASLVDHVTLYDSRLSSQGPTYTALSRACLTPQFT